MNYIKLAKGFLPPYSSIVNIPNTKEPAILLSDLDGDSIPEIAVAYKYMSNNYILTIKNLYGRYFPLSNIKGKGHNITYLAAYPITSKKINNLIAGWQIDSQLSDLSIYQLTQEGFYDVISQNISFSKIDIIYFDHKATNYDIALWTKDTNEAYNVEIYNWKNNSFSIDEAAYPSYFQKVVKFYEKKISENPNMPSYWCYLADAELKMNLPQKALSSLNKALDLNSALSYRKSVSALKSKILYTLKMRNITLYPASIKTSAGTKWGYMSDEGIFKIVPQYDYAANFQNNGTAIIGIGSLQGFIDEKNKYIVPPKYQSIREFSEGLAIASDNEGSKVIDEAGKILTKKVYSFIGDYKNNRAVYSPDGSFYGYLDENGNEIIPAKFISANDFNDEKVVVQVSENNFSLIDKSGNTIKNYNFNFVGNLSEGLLAFRKIKEGKLGYINENGDIIISPKYSSAYPFKYGVAIINAGEDLSINKYGVIDKSGNFIISPEYNNINIVSPDRISLGKAPHESKPYIGLKYALADFNGKFFTAFTYNNIENFSEGYASSSNNRSTFFINEMGKISYTLPVLNGSGVLSFEGNLIKALVDMRVSYYNKSKKLIYSQNTIIPLNKIYSVLEKKYKPNKNYLVYYPEIRGIKPLQKQSNVNNKLKELSMVKPVPNKELDYSYTGDFSIGFFKKDLLVLELYGYNFPFGAAHGMPTEVYTVINLNTGNFYALKDLFKENSDYVNELSNIIKLQINDGSKYPYINKEDYKGIKPDQPFYLDENNLYIYFSPYEIAPYAAGFPVFKIPLSSIMDILNTEGEFYKAFH